MKKVVGCWYLVVGVNNRKGAYASEPPFFDNQQPTTNNPESQANEEVFRVL
ncbi:MAG: hypothetical protein K0Q91_334 [Fibrobacteria bacterium]|jgi:hypothetical protein|nr:hypothetical protein [Fibrobacteria bacterium]